MSLGVIVTVAWLVTTAVVALTMLKRIETRKPDAEWGSRLQLVWHALAALVVIATMYVMLTGAVEGRLAVPGKRIPTQYFYAAHQPIAFWTLLAIEFVLTSVLAALIAATSFLVLRSSWRRA